MIVKIWQHSNVNVNEQPVKVLLNPNVQVGILKPSYPTATTPLSDTDKFLVRQGNDWNEVVKSELGGGGSDTIALTFTLKALINKDGNYTYPPYTYGISSNSWSNIYYDEITALMANGNVNGIIIPTDYKLIGANYSHRISSKDFDFNVTIYKNRIVKGDTVNADAVILGVINSVGLASKKTVETIVIDNPVAFNADEQVIFVFNSNIIMDADAYVDEITITLIFKK